MPWMPMYGGSRLQFLLTVLKVRKNEHIQEFHYIGGTRGLLGDSIFADPLAILGGLLHSALVSSAAEGLKLVSRSDNHGLTYYPPLCCVLP